MRIQKYLSNEGIMSRREAEGYMSQGLVRVNGKVVYDTATKITPGKDVVTFAKKLGKQLEGKITVAVYKPRGVI